MRFDPSNPQCCSISLDWRRPAARSVWSSFLAPAVNPLLIGRWAQYRAIRVEDLADAMLAAARTAKRGVNRYAGENLSALARRSR